MEKIIAVLRDALFDSTPEKDARRKSVEEQEDIRNRLRKKAETQAERLVHLSEVMIVMARDLEALLQRNPSPSSEQVMDLPKWREFFQLRQEEQLLFSFPEHLILREDSYMPTEYRVLTPPGTPSLAEGNMRHQPVRILVPPLMEGSRIVVRGVAKLLDNTR